MKKKDLKRKIESMGRTIIDQEKVIAILLGDDEEKKALVRLNDKMAKDLFEAVMSGTIYK
jgi:hypothetical protein